MTYDAPLSYLIGADEERISPAIGRIIEGPYDAPQFNEPGGKDIAYCNLFHEDYATEGPIYAPYLPDDDTSSQYGEGRVDPRGPGWRNNLDRQYKLRREQGHTCIELDNPDSYEDYFDAVLAELDLCGFDVVAKNPVILKDANALAYVLHPRVIGMVIEHNDLDPAVCVARVNRLRELTNKPTLPIWFVTFADGKAWGEAVAKAAKDYQHIGVTYSQHGEYADAKDVLPYQEGKPPVADPPKWLQVMRAASGTVETPGAADNPKILAMRDEIARDYPEMASYCAQYTHDSIPWCGLAAAYAMSEAGVRPPFGSTDTKKFLWARAWDGDPGFPEISQPRLGCVVVLQREGGGHVSFYERTEGDRYYLTGGNQGDAINTTSFPISSVVALTWPGESLEPPLPPGERRELKEGDTGPDVAALQKVLGLPADGEFGPVTTTQVKAFQVACKIDSDGEVGPQTWEQVDALAARMAAGDAGISDELAAAIAKTASESALAKYSWKDRGRPPVGYIPGMAQTFAVAVREHQAGNPAVVVAAQAAGDSEKDALAWYADQFAAQGMDNATAGLDTLRHLFCLLIGLGMRESSGRYCEGKDASAANTTADTCESGAWQTSWNIRSASSVIPPLLASYWNDPQGFLETFNDGIEPSSSNLAVFGSGDGARYQFLAKYSPAFAAMVTAVGMRVLRKHWGPLNRKEAELRGEADVMLLAVQHMVLATPVEPPPIEPPVDQEAEVIITVRKQGTVKVTVVEMEDVAPEPAVARNKAPAVQATGGSGMSQDTIWQIVRYILIAAGSFFAGKGWVTEDQWIAIVSALGGVFAALWGLYVKWNTATVLADTPNNARTFTGTAVKTVSPVTGQVS